MGKFLLRGNSALVEQALEFWQTHFPDSFYLELIRTGRQDEESYLHAAVQLATEKSLPVVATNDVRFISSEDFDAHEIRVAIHDGYTLADPKRPKLYSPQQYLRSEDEMCELFADIRKHCRTASKLLSVVTSLSVSASISCRSSRPGT